MKSNKDHFPKQVSQQEASL